MWHSRQASATTFPHVSLFTKGDDTAKTVPARCWFWRTIYVLFVPLPPAVLIGFTEGANISLHEAVAKYCFSMLCASVLTQGTKAP